MVKHPVRTEHVAVCGVDLVILDRHDDLPVCRNCQPWTKAKALEEPAPEREAPQPETPPHLTTAQLKLLRGAARAVVLALSLVPDKERSDGERLLYRRCLEIQNVIVEVKDE